MKAQAGTNASSQARAVCHRVDPVSKPGICCDADALDEASVGVTMEATRAERMTKCRHINRPRFVWRPVLAELFNKLYADTATEDLAELLGCSVQQCYARAARQGLHKSEAFFASTASGRTDGSRGAGSRFVKGQPGWNKGLKCPGLGGPTKFKPGHVPSGTMPIGSHRVALGFVEVKLTDRPGPTTNRWKPVHRHVWEQAHGPVPEGHVIAFRPGTKTLDPARITLDILECISLAENCRRNSLHRFGPEIARLIQLRGALTRQINKRTRNAP
jgi:hypothetical protein